MSTTNIPERWERRLIERGYVRTRGAGANLTAFAQQIGVHTSTVSNALRGGPRKPDPDTIVKIVAELGEDTAAWFGVGTVRQWEPPAAAALLTDRQRKALAELIVSMTESGDGSGDTASRSQAGRARTSGVPRGRRGITRAPGVPETNAQVDGDGFVKDEPEG